MDSETLTSHRQTERLEALYDLAVELSSQRSLDSVLNTALKQCLKLTDSQFGFVGFSDDEGKILEVVATVGFELAPEFYQDNRFIPLRPNIFSYVILNNKPIRTADARTDPRKVGQPTDHPPVQTFLGVPLRINNKTNGMIGVANRPTSYEEEHEQLLMTYAAQVAIVSRNRQLFEELEQTNSSLEEMVAQRTAELEVAQQRLAEKAEQLRHLLQETVNVEERERQRIALGIHDGVNQLIYGAMFELKSTRKRLENGNIEQATLSTDAVEEILVQVEQETKRIIYDLRPPMLDTLGLVPTLRRYGKQYEQYTGLPCRVNVLGNIVRIDPTAEVNIYRVVQEALQNCSTHAAATQATVLLSFSPATLKVSISDDGKGFDLSAIQSRYQDRLGLLGMEERAESLGGNLSITSNPGTGTRIEMVVPIKAIRSDEKSEVAHGE